MYSAKGIYLFWKNVLSPDINTDKWLPEEDESLVKIAQKFSFTDWARIASQLDSGRSAFQCLQRINDLVDMNPLDMSSMELISQLIDATEYYQCIGFSDIASAAFIAQIASDSAIKIYASDNPSVSYTKWTVYEDEVILSF